MTSVLTLDWIKAFGLPEEFRDIHLTKVFQPTDELRCTTVEDSKFPAIVYCTLGNRLYQGLEIIKSKAGDTLLPINGEQITLVDFIKFKYGVDVNISSPVVSCLVAKPYGYYSFDGNYHPPKETTERVLLAAELLLVLPKAESFVSRMEHFCISMYFAKRASEVQHLFSILSPKHIMRGGLAQELVNATTTKLAQIGRNNDRLEFLGDSIIQLYLSIVCPNYDSLQERKSNAFLEKIARAFHLNDYIQDSSPLIQKPATLMNRGVFHVTAKSVLADALEAVIAAVFMHAGLDAAFQACLSFGMLSKCEPVDSSRGEFNKTFDFGQVVLRDELNMAGFKAAASLAVFTQLPSCEVGELHIHREAIIGGKKIETYPPVVYSDLSELERMIRDIAGNILVPVLPDRESPRSSGSPRSSKSPSGSPRSSKSAKNTSPSNSRTFIL